MLDPKNWINLSKVTVLLVDGNPTSTQILKQAFAGFGVKRPMTADRLSRGLELAAENEISLIVVSDDLGEESGYDFVRQLRRSGGQNALAPVIMVSGHTKQKHVAAARDCGANFVVAKPITPQVLIERVIWVARDPRPFVDTDVYLGPDRRFQTDEAAETPKRRRSDSRKDEETGPSEAGDMQESA